MTTETRIERVEAECPHGMIDTGKQSDGPMFPDAEELGDDEDLKRLYVLSNGRYQTHVPPEAPKSVVEGDIDVVESRLVIE